MNMTTDQTLTAATDLECPLLPAVEDGDTDGQRDDEGSEQSKLPQETKLRLHALSFATGGYAALLAETILASLLVVPDSTSSSTDLMWFGWKWSAWTCAVVMGVRFVFLRDMKASYCPEKCDAPWNDLQQRMETWLLCGGLVSLATWWVSLKVFLVALPFSQVRTVSIIVGSSALYIIILALTTPRGRGPLVSSSASFFNCIATFWGFFIGFGSQISLGYTFHSGMIHIASSLWNPATISVAWSVGTVLLTVCGIAVLRILKSSSKHSDQRRKLESELVYIRMESFYILCAIMGISFSWITLDSFTMLSEHVIPSCGVLLGSVIAFRAILYCFPEEKCLEDFERTEESSMDV